jgi:hypothetical protein
MDAARPLQPHQRDAVLRECASELSKSELLGVGIVSRITARLQRECLNGPRDLCGIGGKYGY